MTRNQAQRVQTIDEAHHYLFKSKIEISVMCACEQTSYSEVENGSNWAHLK